MSIENIPTGVVGDAWVPREYVTHLVVAVDEALDVTLPVPDAGIGSVLFLSTYSQTLSSSGNLPLGCFYPFQTITFGPFWSQMHWKQSWISP